MGGELGPPIDMKILQIATVGDDVDPIMVGIREYPVSKLVLVYDDHDTENVIDLTEKLAPLKLDIERRPVKGDLLMGILRVVGEVVMDQGLQYDDVIINVGSGNKIMSCAGISAAFVNGLKAIHVHDDRPIQLPVLKFSYSELVSESKLKILAALKETGGSVESLNDLSEGSGVEKSLLSYHIRGGRDSKGLEELGLLEIDRGVQGRLKISLTPMGNLMLMGREEEVTA